MASFSSRSQRLLESQSKITIVFFLFFLLFTLDGKGVNILLTRSTNFKCIMGNPDFPEVKRANFPFQFTTLYTIYCGLTESNGRSVCPSDYTSSTIRNHLRFIANQDCPLYIIRFALYMVYVLYTYCIPAIYILRSSFFPRCMEKPL